MLKPRTRYVASVEKVEFERNKTQQTWHIHLVDIDPPDVEREVLCTTRGGAGYALGFANASPEKRFSHLTGCRLEFRTGNFDARRHMPWAREVRILETEQ